jgi:hypothetical protein
MARRHFKWTPEAIERLWQLAGTMPCKEIAAALGCTRCAVTSKMWEQGIKGRANHAPQQSRTKARVRPAKPLHAAPRLTTTQRIERMMPLAERCR